MMHQNHGLKHELDPACLDACILHSVQAQILNCHGDKRMYLVVHSHRCFDIAQSIFPLIKFVSTGMFLNSGQGPGKAEEGKR